MHRFFVPKDAIAGSTVSLPPDVSGQMRRVLRLLPGDAVVVFDGTGREHVAHITSLRDGQAMADIVSTDSPGTEPATRVNLYSAVVKPDRFELVLQKGVELGAARFVPAITERVQGGLSASPSTRRLARWRRIVQEAAEQSGRLTMPGLSSALPLPEAVRAALTEGPVLLLHPEGQGVGLRATLDELRLERLETLSLVIGPAGGLTDAEVQAAAETGARVVGFGKRVLRSETAAIAALTAVMFHLGELGG